MRNYFSVLSSTVETVPYSYTLLHFGMCLRLWKKEEEKEEGTTRINQDERGDKGRAY